MWLVCSPAPFHDFVARTLNAGEESLLNVCGGFKMAPPHLPGLGAIRIAPDRYRGRAEQSTGHQEGDEEKNQGRSCQLATEKSTSNLRPRNSITHHVPRSFSLSPLPHTEVEKQLESLKHHLWNGNIAPALRLIDFLQLLLEDKIMSPERKKLLKAVREFGGYIATNQQFIPDYGDRYRNEETITTSFVESAVNQVVSKRFVKSQQMRWSQHGAHLLLQVRTHVLNKELRDRFQQWYPDMAEDSELEMRAAA